MASRKVQELLAQFKSFNAEEQKAFLSEAVPVHVEAVANEAKTTALANILGDRAGQTQQRRQATSAQTQKAQTSDQTQKAEGATSGSTETTSSGSTGRRGRRGPRGGNTATLTDIIVRSVAERSGGDLNKPVAPADILKDIEASGYKSKSEDPKKRDNMYRGYLTNLSKDDSQILRKGARSEYFLGPKAQEVLERLGIQVNQTEQQTQAPEQATVQAPAGEKVAVENIVGNAVKQIVEAVSQQSQTAPAAGAAV